MKTVSVKIDPDVAEVLSRATCSGDLVVLPAGQLERPLYERVNKVLVALGGRWNKSRRGHVFERNPAAVLAESLTVGHAVDEKKSNGFFETPWKIAEQLVELAMMDDSAVVLEPSAGLGAIARCIYDEIPFGTLHVCEINPERAANLLNSGFIVVADDFFEYTPGPIYDRIIANPPFNGGEDVKHVRHMMELVKPGGRLVTVMAASIKFREDSAHSSLRAVVDRHGEIHDLPDGAFKAAGTGVRACIVVMNRPKSGDWGGGE